MRTEDEQLLEKVSELMRSVPSVYPENELEPMTVEELEERVNQSRKDVSEGKFRTTEELKEYFRNR